MTSPFTEIELDEDDINQARASFQRKQDVHGRIDPSEITEMLRENGIVITRIALETLIKNEQPEIQKTNNKIDWSTFMRIYKKSFSDQPNDQVLLNAIKTLIPAGRQAVPSSYMREVLMNFGDVFSAREADEFIRECDQFGTGEIDAETVTNKLVYYLNDF